MPRLILIMDDQGRISPEKFVSIPSICAILILPPPMDSPIISSFFPETPFNFSSTVLGCPSFNLASPNSIPTSFLLQSSDCQQFFHRQDSFPGVLHKCLIRSMPFPGCKKGSIKEDPCLFHIFSQQISCHKTNSRRPCGMRAGRSDHNRSDNVKNSHLFSPFLSVDTRLSLTIIISQKGQKFNLPIERLKLVCLIFQIL